MSIKEIRHLCVRFFLSSIKEFTDTEANRQELYLEEEVLERAKPDPLGSSRTADLIRGTWMFLLWPRDVKKEVPSGNHQTVFTFLIIKIYN